MRIGVLCSLVRVEEKLIFQALRQRGVEFERLDDRQLVFDLNGGATPPCELVLVRCVSYSRALYATRLLEMHGVKTISSHRAVATCGDKIMTTQAFLERGIPTPHTAVALSEETSLEAMEVLGYPVVLKPPIGSWGRLIVKINDRQAAEAVVEYKQALEKEHDQPFYLQEYIDKPGRDIRTLVVGDETVYAIYRNSSHWITNTARGSSVSNLPVTAEIDRLSRSAADAVGGDIVAVDLLETRQGDLLVNEVNHTPEFHGAAQVANVDIAGKMVDYVIRVAQEAR
jgi:[lysine-biosynthesis-protein LysW]--L-2-aminoadipate ligase